MINIFLLSLLFIYLFKAYLDLRYILHIKNNISVPPSELADNITEEDHTKAAEYTLAKLKFGMFNYAITYLFICFIFKADYLDYNYQFVEQWMNSFVGKLSFLNQTIPILIVSYFCFGLFQSLIHLPSELYHTFVLEEKFGFNKTTLKTFILDMIKGSLVSLILGSLILSAIFYLMMKLSNWWFWAATTMVLFQLLLLFIYPKFLAPLFNKFTPVQDQDLLQKLKDLSQNSGVEFKDYFLMDASKRSSHGNAYFTGFGKNKRIVLFDTLAKKLTNDEIISVMAHELGHFKLKHILKMIIISVFSLYIGFFFLYQFYGNESLFTLFGVDEKNYANLLILTGLLFSPLSFLFSPFFSLFSRKNEFEADAFATEQGHGPNLVVSLIKLMKDNASFSYPEPFYSFFYYSHPPVIERIKAIRKKF